MAANYSTFERTLASLLSIAPGLKTVVEYAYALINSVIHRKGYRMRILDNRVKSIDVVCDTVTRESFGGYYDTSSVNTAGMVAMCVTSRRTSSKPSSQTPVDIMVYDTSRGEAFNIDRTYSYNWQQGARVQWLDDDRLIYNVYEDGKYRSVVYSLSMRSRVKTFDAPNQTASRDGFFLSIDYRRVMALRPDYGYRNVPAMTKQELQDVVDDGIWKVDMATGEVRLLHSLSSVMAVSPKSDYKDALHKVNHVMISPDGKGFIFIHRWYMGGRRFDRLMYSDFHSMKVLADDRMVSHMNWLDSNRVFGYLRHDGKDGFYEINVQTGDVLPCADLTSLGTGDGHPTIYGDYIVIDTYPDKSRMQTLFLYNQKTRQVVPLLEVFHGMSYYGESRCDLHPRFSPDGKGLFFDSVFDGQRHLCRIRVTDIVDNP